MSAPRESAPAGTEGVEIPEDVALAVSDYGRACEYMGELAHRPGTERATREAGEARQEADREIVKALTFWRARAEAAERERKAAVMVSDVEMGEFHWRDGWLFLRLQDGSVRIRHGADVAVIPSAEWESVLRETRSLDRQDELAVMVERLSADVADDGPRFEAFMAQRVALPAEVERLRSARDAAVEFAHYWMTTPCLTDLLGEGNDDGCGCMACASRVLLAALANPALPAPAPTMAGEP